MLELELHVTSLDHYNDINTTSRNRVVTIRTCNVTSRTCDGLGALDAFLGEQIAEAVGTVGLVVT